MLCKAANLKLNFTLCTTVYNIKKMCFDGYIKGALLQRVQRKKADGIPTQ